MSGTSVQIDKLSKHNFDTWKLQIEAVLIKSDRWGYVDGNTELPENSTEAQSAIWLKGDKKARPDIILAINLSELCHIRHCTTSKEVWEKLEEVSRS